MVTLYRDQLLKDGELAVLLLLFPLKMPTSDCCREGLGELRPFVDLFWRRHFTLLVGERCGNFGFEELLLLLRHGVPGSPAFLS